MFLTSALLSIVAAEPQLMLLRKTCAYPYNSTDAEKTVNGVKLSPRQKAKARNAYIAPYRIDYSKDNGAGKGVFESRDFENKETNPCE